MRHKKDRKPSYLCDAMLLLRFKHSKFCMFTLKAGLTLFVLWILLRQTDLSFANAMLSRQDHGLIAVTAVFMLAQILFGAARWRIILAAIAAKGERLISRIAALRIFYIAVFFSCCLPGTIGSDIVRVWMSRTEEIPMPVAIHSVIIDRLMALVALVVMVVAALFLLGNVLILPPFIVAVAAALWLLFRMDRLLAPLKRFRVIQWVLYLAGSTRMILMRPRACMVALLLSILSHSGFCIGAWVLAQSLDIHFTFLQSFALIPPAVLASMLPISIGGWGVREAGFVSMLGLVGIPATAALTLSVQLGLLGILISLPGGFLWLAHRPPVQARAAI